MLFATLVPMALTFILLLIMVAMPSLALLLPLMRKFFSPLVTLITSLVCGPVLARPAAVSSKALLVKLEVLVSYLSLGRLIQLRVPMDAFGFSTRRPARSR